MIGLVVDGKYRVVRQLGEGGMGAVYEAIHDGTRRRVALKVILNANLAENSDMVRRFQREARAAGAIDTQHIVQVFDTGCDPTTKHPFMVMEYLAGEDLSSVVRRLGPLPPELALQIVLQAALGLTKAHAAGVVHRDIKPANLYLAEREAGELIVKVLDFGIAKVSIDQLSSVENAALTRTGNMLGSPLYMSPEQAKGLRTVNQQTDVWSLGVVLYEALCGRTPNGHLDSLGQLILAICSEPPAPIQSLAPWVPPEIARILHRALQIDTELRYQTMSEMLDALRALLPRGWALQKSMVVALSPEARAYAAPRFAASEPNVTVALPPSAPALPSANANVTTGRASDPGPISQLSSTVEMGGVHAISQGGVSSANIAPPRRSTAPIAVATVVGAAVLMGGGFFGLRAYRDRHLAPPPTVTMTSTAPPIASLVTASAEPPPSSAPLPVDPPDAGTHVHVQPPAGAGAPPARRPAAKPSAAPAPAPTPSASAPKPGIERKTDEFK